MKILHVVPTYLPAIRYGGPIYSVHGLCQALVNLGHEVHVFTTSVDGPADSNVIHECPVDVNGVNVWYFRCRWLRRLYFAPALQRRLQEEISSFDLVHLHSVFLWPTWAAARAARKAGIPYVLSPRGMLVKDLIARKSTLIKKIWIRCIEKRNLEQAALIHLTSALEADELERFSFALRNKAVVANGVQQPQQWSLAEVQEDVCRGIKHDKYVLYFGRITWKKGLDLLLRSWKDVFGARLIIAGNDEDGYCSKLQEIARQEGVEDSVVFLPRLITGADKEALFAGAKIFVLPSRSENFGITVLEALVRRVPVIVTADVGAAEIVHHSGGGRVEEQKNFGTVLDTMLKDNPLLQQMGENGYNWVQDRYSWSAIAREMVKEYTTVMQAGASE